MASRGLNKFHADTIADLLAKAGYENEFIMRVAQAVGKKSLKTNPDTQLLEDVAGLVFWEHYLLDFAGRHPERPLHGVMSGTRIRQKFAKKRSLHGVNEHFSRIFNAIIVPRSNRAKVSLNTTNRSGSISFVEFGISCPLKRINSYSQDTSNYPIHWRR